MTRWASLACAALLVSSAACEDDEAVVVADAGDTMGDEADAGGDGAADDGMDGSTPPDGTVGGVDPERSLADLSPEESLAVCEAVAAQIEGIEDEPDVVTGICGAVGVVVAADEGLECADVRRACIEDPDGFFDEDEEQGDAGPDGGAGGDEDEDEGCMAATLPCEDVTAGDLNACFAAFGEANRQALIGIDCNTPLDELPDLEEDEPPVQAATVPECQAIMAACPGVFDDF